MLLVYMHILSVYIHILSVYIHVLSVYIHILSAYIHVLSVYIRMLSVYKLIHSKLSVYKSIKFSSSSKKLLKSTAMRGSKKLRILLLKFILYWLIISNAVAPILCMDTDQASKGILNADLPMPGADIPIISLSTPSPKKSSQAYSQVCGMY